MLAIKFPREKLNRGGFQMKFDKSRKEEMSSFEPKKEGKKYLYQLLFSVSRWKKVGIITAYIVLSISISFILSKDEYQRDVVFSEEIYEDACKVAENVKVGKFGLESKFEDVEHEVILTKYELIEGKVVYTYWFREYILSDGTDEGISLEISMKENGRLEYTSPDLSLKENLAYEAVLKRRERILVLTLIFLTIPLTVFLFSAFHRMIEEESAERKSKLSSKKSLKKEAKEESSE